jgi:hypothetical protein
LPGRCRPFNAAPAFPAGDAPAAIAAADFNGDGHLDFAVANEISFGTVTVSLGDGHGGFVEAGSFSTAAINSVAIVAGDFNATGIPIRTLVTALTVAPMALSVLLGNGDGSFNRGHLPRSGSPPERDCRR